MSRIPPHWLNCSFYVYRTVADAQDGTQSGGSGCLVGVRSKHEPWVHLYAVTNRHIIDAGFGVLRLNTLDGRTSTIETTHDQWHRRDESGDVAVLPLDLGEQFRWHPIFTDNFLTREIMQEFQIWPGDDVFLIGRLITQAGRQRNTPVARFGNLSMLADADEPVTGQYGDHETFLVECRSLGGFSGSPVFITTTQTYMPSGEVPLDSVPLIGRSGGIPVTRTGPKSGQTVIVSLDGTFGPWFLGLDWGHVPLWGKVYERDKQTVVSQGYMVEANTGIACVAPAWLILDLLNKESLVKQRERDDQEIEEKVANMAIADTATDPVGS